MIYLDNAATTFPKPEEVYVAMDQMNRNGAVNAGRGSYGLAQQASRLIAETKSKLRDLVHADASSTVIFSPSVTIAMNQIIHGIHLRDNAVVYVSPYEHNAVARTLYDVAKTKNWHIKEMPLDDKLEIDFDKLSYEFIKDKPDAVFCIHVSNVTGYILPIKKIFEEAKKYGCVTILDTAQSMGLVEIRADQISADIIAFAGHKTIYGPIGIGGFINVSGVELDVFLAGGTGSDSLNLSMPSAGDNRYEPASHNITAVAGLNAALKVLRQENCYAHEKEISNYAIKRLKEIEGVKVFVPGNLDNHIGVISFVVGGYSSEDIGAILDSDYNIAVRTGYHCAPYIHKYLRDENSLGTVRIGISQFTTTEEIDQLIDALKEIAYE